MWLFFLLSGILRLGAWRTAHIAFHFFVFLFWEIPPVCTVLGVCLEKIMLLLLLLLYATIFI